MAHNPKYLNVPMDSQQENMPTISGGHPAGPMVLPGGKVISTSLSVSGQLPVVNR